MKHVVILGVQVPFVTGGAELLNRSLVREINKLEGVKAEEVKLPFKWYPETQMLNEIMAWRLLDLSEANGRKIDLSIATKFPTYALPHKNKALWLVHQHRTLYDLENTEYDCWNLGPDCKLIRDKIRNLDDKFFHECKCHYTISRTVSERLEKFNGFTSKPLFPPPFLADKIKPGKYNDKIVYIGRLEPNKRPDLLIEAAKNCKKAKISIIGKGRKEDNEKLMGLLKNRGLSNRCELLGFLTEGDFLRHLSEARAIFYGPLDEDYGYATIEAFLAQKPVITCRDSGEAKLFVEETGAGFISDPEPISIANNLSAIYDLSDIELKEMAVPGYDLAQTITWSKILEELVLDNLTDK
ncbi:MAG: glycosyltransferase [Deltaproteobacteria bacterium]|nr:glycosyltransferase [Deltaproteobacteria bacterium]